MGVSSCYLQTSRKCRFFTWPGFPLGWTGALCTTGWAQSSSSPFNFSWDLAGSRRSSHHRASLGLLPPVPWRKWIRYHWVVLRALTALFLFSHTLGEEVEVPCYCCREVAIQTLSWSSLQHGTRSVRDGKLSSPVSLFWYQAAEAKLECLTVARQGWKSHFSTQNFARKDEAGAYSTPVIGWRFFSCYLVLWLQRGGCTRVLLAAPPVFILRYMRQKGNFRIHQVVPHKHRYKYLPVLNLYLVVEIGKSTSILLHTLWKFNKIHMILVL